MKRIANKLHESVLEDALLANGMAHLNDEEIPTWIAETSGHDLLGEASEAQNDLEGSARDAFNAMLADVCSRGEDMPAVRAIEFIRAIQAMMLAHCTAQAQRFVEREVG